MVLAIRSSDIVEEDGLSSVQKTVSYDGENSHLDDASSTPHTSDTGVVQVPVELHEC